MKHMSAIGYSNLSTSPHEAVIIQNNCPVDFLHFILFLAGNKMAMSSLYKDLVNLVKDLE